MANVKSLEVKDRAELAYVTIHEYRKLLKHESVSAASTSIHII